MAFFGEMCTIKLPPAEFPDMDASFLLTAF